MRLLRGPSHERTLLAPSDLTSSKKFTPTLQLSLNSSAPAAVPEPVSVFPAERVLLRLLSDGPERQEVALSSVFFATLFACIMA